MPRPKQSPSITLYIQFNATLCGYLKLFRMCPFTTKTFSPPTFRHLPNPSTTHRYVHRIIIAIVCLVGHYYYHLRSVPLLEPAENCLFLHEFTMTWNAIQIESLTVLVLFSVPVLADSPLANQ